MHQMVLLYLMEVVLVVPEALELTMAYHEMRAKETTQSLQTMTRYLHKQKLARG